jgi:hypothetical protein
VPLLALVKTKKNGYPHGQPFSTSSNQIWLIQKKLLESKFCMAVSHLGTQLRDDHYCQSVDIDTHRGT